jgi:hypothetical protein
LEALGIWKFLGHYRVKPTTQTVYRVDERLRRAALAGQSRGCNQPRVSATSSYRELQRHGCAPGGVRAGQRDADALSGVMTNGTPQRDKHLLLIASPYGFEREQVVWAHCQPDNTLCIPAQARNSDMCAEFSQKFVHPCHGLRLCVLCVDGLIKSLLGCLQRTVSRFQIRKNADWYALRQRLQPRQEGDPNLRLLRLMVVGDFMKSDRSQPFLVKKPDDFFQKAQGFGASRIVSRGRHQAPR